MAGYCRSKEPWVDLCGQRPTSSWKTIAAALAEAGIDVHLETLRLFMNDQERDLKSIRKQLRFPRCGDV
jgi:hypothetical protein